MQNNENSLPCSHFSPLVTVFFFPFMGSLLKRWSVHGICTSLLVIHSSIFSAYPPPTPLSILIQANNNLLICKSNRHFISFFSDLSMAFGCHNHFRLCETPFFNITLTQFPFDLSGSSFSTSFMVPPSFCLYLLNVGFSWELFCLTFSFLHSSVVSEIDVAFLRIGNLVKAPHLSRVESKMLWLNIFPTGLSTQSWIELCPPQRRVEVLTTNTCECDLI